jgi:hypothetical protein
MVCHLQKMQIMIVENVILNSIRLRKMDEHMKKVHNLKISDE